MKDIKNFFHTLKVLWKNPKFKGVVQIIFWVIFFVIVAIIFRTTEKSQKQSSEIIENEQNEEVVSYEYEYQYSDTLNTIIISGTYYDKKEVFYFNNNKYYFVDNIYYNALDKTVTNFDYAFNEWNYKSIKNIMDNNSYSNKTSYKSGNIKYEYTINNLIYNNYYGTNYQNDIVINITVKENKIVDAIINYGFASVTISYTNINEIDDLDINID